MIELDDASSLGLKETEDRDLALVGSKKFSEVGEFSTDEVMAAMRILLERHYQNTRRNQVLHIPKAEIVQAKKEFARDPSPVTISDFLKFKKRTDKKAAELCKILGITRQRYYDITLHRGDKSEVLKEVTLALVLRLYMKLPSLIPSDIPDPMEVHEVIGGVDRINPSAMAIVLGKGSASSRRWKSGDTPSEISRPLLDPLLYSDRPHDLLEIMIDNVYEEGAVRGLTPFKSMGWSGVPEETPQADLARSFLNAPTVDHRRHESREGKVKGWGATEVDWDAPTQKVVKKVVRRGEKNPSKSSKAG